MVRGCGADNRNVGLLSRNGNVATALGATAGFFLLAALIVLFFMRETRGQALS
ncbi:hypothetical protein LJ656_08300 [Paraburkholderia sp. MMS20-SJTR3]|uniref:Uncharacterized protein n=1 Tax=Paraburkholderia sejongensis TaxID=2886946 RepID=A0ABS8JRR5_9BURK|nr:hypothetical protein [Paraburkholderia sp. MMS20-SJTR3]MCC8392586.1 hypothetical protein [Paraburkholderia sp. MMS20-SJTR3]